MNPPDYSREARDRALVSAWNDGEPLQQMADALAIQPGSVRVTVQRAARRIGAELHRPGVAAEARATTTRRLADLENQVAYLESRLSDLESRLFWVEAETDE